MPDITEAVIPVSKLLEVYGMYGVCGILFVLLVALYIHSSRKYDKLVEKFTTELRTQSASYGKLLEERHEQFIALFRDNGEVIEEMTKTSVEAQKVFEDAQRIMREMDKTILACKYARLPEKE